MGMGFKNGFEKQVFPKFITITQFTIHKPFFVIMFQGMKINVSIVGKIICKTIVASVTIAK